MTEITWPEIALRLLLTFAAGTLIGLNREEAGRPAGLRTTVLVCLAASASMILANLLLGTRGRVPDAFVSMDVMRLPLGILTGVGFIGAGAILRKGNVISGLTTAATLWFSTVMGFCFGSGQTLLGLVLSGLGIFILWALRWVEALLKQRYQATLTVAVSPEGPSIQEIRQCLETGRHQFSTLAVRYTSRGRKLRFDVHWQARSSEKDVLPDRVTQLAAHPEVIEVHWLLHS